MSAGEAYSAAKANIAEYVDGAVQQYIDLLDFVAPGTAATQGEFIRNFVGNALLDMVMQTVSPLRICGAATELDYYQGVPA